MQMHMTAILDVFTAIRAHIKLDQAGRLLAFNSQRFLCPAREMCALFRDVPGAIENTGHLSSRLNNLEWAWKERQDGALLSKCRF